jgi:hypothetical protein
MYEVGIRLERREAELARCGGRDRDSTHLESVLDRLHYRKVLVL